MVDGADTDRDPPTVTNPVTRERFRFHSRPADPTSDPLGFELQAPPDMTPLGTHVHPRQDETFTVESGRVRLSRNGVDEVLEPGESTTVPAGTPHTWRPAGDDPLRLEVVFDPGLSTESFLRDLAALAERGAVGEDGVPSLLYVAALYDAYGYDLMRLASPPLPVQRLVFGALSPVSRALGYRADPVSNRPT